MKWPSTGITAGDIPGGQAELLKTIQNAGVQLAHGIEQSHQLIEDPSARHGYQARRVRWVSEEIAASIGVPAAWIAHARTAGDEGRRWRITQRMPAPGPVDRDRLIEGLAVEARKLKAMAAVSAAYRHRFGEPVPGEWTRFQHRMSTQWEQVGAVGLALDATAAERGRMWPTDTATWQRIAATVEAEGPGTIEATWQQIAAPANPWIVRLPVTLLRLAQIDVHTADPARLPPPPAQMIALADTATRAFEHSTIGRHDMAIDAAIDAAILDDPHAHLADDPAGADLGGGDPASVNPVLAEGIDP